jgi:hypothetical protein
MASPDNYAIEKESELWRRFARERDPAIRDELVRRNLDFAICSQSPALPKTP